MAWEDTPHYATLVIVDEHGNRSFHSNFVQATPSTGGDGAGDVDLSGYVTEGDFIDGLSGEATARYQGDATTLADAKSYTDAQVAAVPAPDLTGYATTAALDAEATARTQGDATALSDAQAYTDAAVGSHTHSLAEITTTGAAGEQVVVGSGGTLTTAPAGEGGGGSAEVPGVTTPITETTLPAVVKVADFSGVAWTAGTSKRKKFTYSGPIPATGVLRARAWATVSDAFGIAPVLVTPQAGGLGTSSGGFQFDCYPLQAIPSSTTSFVTVWAEIYWTAT